MQDAVTKIRCCMQDLEMILTNKSNFTTLWEEIEAGECVTALSIAYTNVQSVRSIKVSY